MTRSREVRTNITADEKDLLRGLQSAKRALADYERQMEQSGVATTKAAQPTKGLTSDFGALQSKALLVAGAVGAVTAAAYTGGRVIAGLASAASDLAESQNKANVVFGQSSRQIGDFAETSASAFGLSKRAAFEAAGAYGNMFNTIGLGQEEAAGMSVRLVQLAADMASFNNQDPSEMLQKLRAGLAGEAEPLRTVGVLLSEARVKQEAYTSGIARMGAELTEAQKVQARYQLILKDTTVQHGDFERTSDGLANKQRQLAATFDDLKVKIGEGVVGPMTSAVTVTNDLLTGIGKLIDLATKPIEFTVTVNGQAQIKQGPSFTSAIGDIFGPGGLLDPSSALAGGIFGFSDRDREFVKLRDRLRFGTPGDPTMRFGGLAGNAKFPLFDPAFDSMTEAPLGDPGVDFDEFNRWLFQNGLRGLGEEGLAEGPKSLLGLDSGGAARKTDAQRAAERAAERAFSPAMRARIASALRGIPDAPLGNDLAGFSRAESAFGGVRAGISREMADLGLRMADLSAQGLSNTDAFAALEEELRALQDASTRLGHEETLRLDAVRGQIELTREAARAAQEAAEAERELADRRRREMHDLLTSAWRTNNAGVGGALAIQAALANPGQSFRSSDFDPNRQSSDGTVNYGVININVQSPDGGASIPAGVTATD